MFAIDAVRRLAVLREPPVIVAKLHTSSGRRNAICPCRHSRYESAVEPLWNNGCGRGARSETFDE